MTVVSSPPSHPKISLDTDQLRTDVEAPDIDEHLAASMDLSQSLGCSGTPSFVIGNLEKGPPQNRIFLARTR